MKSFKSKSIKVNSNGKTTTFFVENDRDRIIGEDNFKDLYPLVKIDGDIYETIDIDCAFISFIEKGRIFGIIV